MDAKAAVAFQENAPLEIETVQFEGPRSSEVLIEIKATGLAIPTSSLVQARGDPEGIFPAILGHEGTGVVVDVDPNVRSLKKGDHGIPLYTPGCRECSYCTSGKTNLC